MTWSGEQAKPRGGPRRRKRPKSSRPRRPRRKIAKQEAFELVLSTLDALTSERGAEDKIWGSMVKQALKRQRPGFNEWYYGFRSFNDLLEEAAQRRLVTLERDDKSGGYLVHSTGEGG